MSVKPYKAIIGCGVCTVLMIMTLGLVIGLSYVPTRDALVHLDCRIVAKEKNHEYINPSRSFEYYFYRVKTGDQAYIWIQKSYYTIDITYIHPNDTNPENERSYKDGYNREKSRNVAYESVSLNDTTSCWYNTDTRKLTVTRDQQLKGPAWGVAVMTIVVFFSFLGMFLLYFCY